MLLYPPTIEGQLPPAVLKDSIITFTIPYQINKGTNPTSIAGYSIKIKNLISEKLLITHNLVGTAADQVTFGISILDLNANLGDQFKIQVAFKDTAGQIGYFSTVGVCKLIAKPELKLTLNNKDWVGVYINSQPDELIYTSQFILKDDLGQIIEKGEVETINYMDTAEDEEFYKTYFENTIVPGLEKEANAAIKDWYWEIDGNSGGYKVWYNNNIKTIKSISITSLSIKPATYTTEDVEWLKNFLIFKTDKVSIFKGYLETIKTNLKNKAYDMLDYKGIISQLQTQVNDINGETEDLIEKGYSCSKNQYNQMISIIQELDNLTEQSKNLFIIHKTELENKSSYWTTQRSSEFSDYYDSVKKSGKVCTHRFNSALKIGYQYVAEWHIETSSGYKDSISSNLVIANNEVLSPDYTLIPVVRFSEENGCAELAVKAGVGASSTAEANYGRWVITKASSKDNFNSWTELALIDDFYSWYLSPKDNEFKNILIKDYEIEHGVSYKYALQQINKYNLYSVKITTPIVIAKFEDVFLCDEDRQLRLAFNPKVSSMKDNILESKQDTIGGKYPYIFRNDQVNYKNFSLSGLISYLQDPNNEFKVSFGDYKEVNTTNLTNENITKERIFKLEVLDWLNNGKTKLLKSPTEGNYQVRIMNVSMSPNDTLGRLLHNFTATAIEVKDETFKVKVDLGFSGKELIQVATIGAASGFNWSDKIIKSLWVYGDSLTPGITKTLKIPENENTKSYHVTHTGLRIEYPNGVRITDEPKVDKGTGLEKLTIDVYYTLDPQLVELEKSFSKVVSCGLKEHIGTKQGSTMYYPDPNLKPEPFEIISGQNYYKTIIGAYTDLNGKGFDPNDVNRQIWITDSSGTINKYSVVDQIYFEDIYANTIAWGSDIQLTYCYVSPEIKYKEGDGVN